jgi:hypothetical protein
VKAHFGDVDLDVADHPEHAITARRPTGRRASNG